MAERFRQPRTRHGRRSHRTHARENHHPRTRSYKIVDRKKPTVAPDDFIPYRPDEDDVPPMPAFGDGYRWHVTGLTTNEWGFPTNDAPDIDLKANRIIRKVDRYPRRNSFLQRRLHGRRRNSRSLLRLRLPARRSAPSASSASRASRSDTSVPSPSGRSRTKRSPRSRRTSSTSSSPELNAGQLVHEVERAVKRNCEVHGKSLINGELYKPAEIMSFIKEWRNDATRRR